MNSVGCSMPAVVYCDRGTQLLPLEQLQKEADLDWLNDSTYHEVKNRLTAAGVIIKASTAHSPWKRGKVERLISITKKALKQVGIKQTTFTDMQHLISKVETLVNTRA